MDLLSKRTQAFVSIALALALSKFLQESLYVMSYFMEKDFGISASLIYETAKYQPLGVAVGYITTAFFVDRFGIKKMLAGSMLALSIALLGFSQNHNFSMLLCYRMLIGMCIGCIYNCSFGALPIIFNNEELPRKTSLLYTFAFLAALIAPQSLTMTENICSWRSLISFLSAITCFGGLYAFIVFPHKQGRMSLTQYCTQMRSLLKNKIFLLMIIVSTLCMGGFYGFVAIFINNLQQLGMSSEISKFIVTDMQFIGRLLLFIVTLIAGIKLTQKSIPFVLKAALSVMGISALGLFVFLYSTSSLFGHVQILNYLSELASNHQHVFVPLISCFSGVYLFWVYAALIGAAQPANKSKALSIAGKDMSGSAQATLGFCLSIGEFIFAILASSAWPFGAYSFLMFIVLAASTVILGLHKNKNDL